MGVVRIYVDSSLKDILEELRIQVAGDLKKKYKLKEITVPRTLSSEILAKKMKGNTILKYKIQKTTKNKGKLVLS